MSALDFLVQDPVEVAASLVRRIEAELASALPEGADSDVPGGPVAFAAGHLYLLADDRARSDLQVTLWPRVRQWLGTPAALIRGTYRAPSVIAATVIEANYLPTPVAEAAPFAAMDSPAAPRPKPLTVLLDAPLGATASAEHPHGFLLTGEAVAMLRMRLEAGFLLAACDALWPSGAEGLCRLLWHDAHLAAWDRSLARFAAVLDPLAPAARRLLAGTCAPLDEERFGPLLTLARGSTGETGQAVALGQVTGRLLAERLVRLEHPAHHVAGHYAIWEETGRVYVDLWEPAAWLELVRTDDSGLEVATLVTREGPG